MAEQRGRTETAKSTAIAAVYIPLSILTIIVATLGLLVLHVVDLVWALGTGADRTRENTRLGYLLYWAQNNIQALTVGRGEFRMTPGLSRRGRN